MRAWSSATGTLRVPCSIESILFRSGIPVLLPSLSIAWRPLRTIVLGLLNGLYTGAWVKDCNMKHTDVVPPTGGHSLPDKYVRKDVAGLDGVTVASDLDR